MQRDYQSQLEQMSSKWRQNRMHELVSKLMPNAFPFLRRLPTFKEIAPEEILLMRSELAYLRQLPSLARATRWGLEIPESWFEAPSPLPRQDDYPGVLSSLGERHLRRELHKQLEQRVEFWSKLIVPYVALGLSILNLVRSMK